MLQLLKKGKGGHNFKIRDIELDWRTLFKATEDSLTANVFERLFYLPNNLLWDILLNTLPNCQIPRSDIQSFEFWPYWGSATNEVDVFIRCQDFDLIIEAKRNDHEDLQGEAQWQGEIDSYLRYFNESSKPVFLLALGGNATNNRGIKEVTVNGTSFSVYRQTWTSLLNATLEMKRRITLSSHNPITNILNDLIDCFEMQGFSAGKLLHEFKADNYTINNLSLEYFKSNQFTL